MEKRDNSKDGLILLVGGGTGGHIYPLVAIAEELKVRHLPFAFVGSPESQEEAVVRGLNWPFYVIAAGKWRRYTNFLAVFQNMVDIGRVVVGVIQAVRLIRRLRAKLIFSKGGFVAVPVVIASRIIGVPVMVHESDAVMGVTNRLAARFAKVVFTNFSPSVFPRADRRYQQVGLPIRRALRQAATLKAPRKERPLILILPGSQGSAAINELLRPILPRLLAVADIVHLTGTKEYGQFLELKKELTVADQSRYKPYQFIDRELPLYFQMADLMIARASATTTAEAALFKKALYLIPLPTAANNHQLVNARILEKAGAAIIREQHQLTPEIFANDIEELLNSPKRLSQLGETLHNYFNEQSATGHIIKEMINER